MLIGHATFLYSLPLGGLKRVRHVYDGSETWLKWPYNESMPKTVSPLRCNLNLKQITFLSTMLEYLVNPSVNYLLEFVQLQTAHKKS